MRLAVLNGPLASPCSPSSGAAVKDRGYLIDLRVSLSYPGSKEEALGMLCPAMFTQLIMRAGGQDVHCCPCYINHFPYQLASQTSDARHGTSSSCHIVLGTCQTHRPRGTLNPVNHVWLKFVAFPSHLSFNLSLLPGPKHDRSYRSYRS